MTSGSSLSNAYFSAIIAGAAGLVGGGLSIATSDWWAAAAAILVVAAASGAVLALRRAQADVRRALDTCRSATHGDFEVRTAGIADTGLVGELLWTVNDLVDRTDAFVREAAASMDAVSRNQYFRRIVPGGMDGGFRHGATVINGAVVAMAGKVSDFRDATRRFETTVHAIVDTVASAATELQATSQAMSGTAGRTADQATMAAAAAEQTSANVQTVAAAADQLSASIVEIAGQVSHSSRIAMSAVDEAERTNVIVASLTDAAQKIGAVISLINDIAHQTNLLALNATIEAARAGEAGKGFAVVASEVKNLATQTARATGDIATQIGGMQTATRQAVEAIRSITRVIGEIEGITTGIAAAVEEQGAATREIARNVDQAAAGSGSVSGNVQEVNRAAGEAGHAAAQVMDAAGDLSRQSEHLRSEVSGFLAVLQRVA